MLCGPGEFRMLEHRVPRENVCRTVYHELALLHTPSHRIGWAQKQSIMKWKWFSQKA